MNQLDIFCLYKQLSDQNILIEFKGALSQEILLQMADSINLKVKSESKIHKIFSIFIELAQNIMKYSAEKEIINEKNIGVGIILLTENTTCYSISSGNLILNSNIESITKLLNIINSADNISLKNMFKEQSKKPIIPGQMGAGLGFIEIAIKSKNKIDFQIISVDDKSSFLIITTKIEKE